MFAPDCQAIARVFPDLCPRRLENRDEMTTALSLMGDAGDMYKRWVKKGVAKDLHPPRDGYCSSRQDASGISITEYLIFKVAKIGAI